MNTKINSEYEYFFSKMLDASYAHTFWKGRTALYAILKSLMIGPGDEVIVPAFTCVVVSNAIISTGAKPVYVDISPNTYNIDPSIVEKCITPNTKAIVIQHTFGIPAELDPLLDIAKCHNLSVIEDCAHAIGSKYRGRLVGTFGDAAFFSSQWSKPYTTGLGGIAITSNEAIEEGLKNVLSEFTYPCKIQLNRLKIQYMLYYLFFSPRLYWFSLGTLQRLSQMNLFIGSSSRDELDGVMPPDHSWKMSPFQARIGLRQVHCLPQYIEHRRRLAKLYENYLRSHAWNPSKTPQEYEIVYLRYPIRVANKWDFLRKAQDARIEIGSWFESVLHPIRTSLKHFGYKQGQCPIAEVAANEVVNLPLHHRVTVEEAERIIEFVYKEAEKPFSR